MSEIYRTKSYGELEIGFGHRLGILVVDFQKGFTDPRFPMGGGERIDAAVDSFQYGFRTMLVDDCCADQEEQPHLDTLRDVGRRYADVVTCEQVVDYLHSNSRAAASN